MRFRAMRSFRALDAKWVWMWIMSFARTPYYAELCRRAGQVLDGGFRLAALVMYPSANRDIIFSSPNC